MPVCGGRNPCFVIAHRLPPPRHTNPADIIIAEFTDDRVNFNFTRDGDFFEYYDLQSDPYQLRNSFNTTATNITQPLLKTLRQLFRCQGPTCN